MFPVDVFSLFGADCQQKTDVSSGFGEETIPLFSAIFLGGLLIKTLKNKTNQHTSAKTTSHLHKKDLRLPISDVCFPQGPFFFIVLFWKIWLHPAVLFVAPAGSGAVS